MKATYSVTFLTRFYPPHPNINGKEVRDMADYLITRHNIEVNIITVDRNLEVGGVSRAKPIGNVIKLKTKFHKPSKISKLLAMFYDGYIMIKQAKKINSTFSIVTSSPPLLPFWASKLLTQKNIWAFWSLDLFPEGLAASGYISKRNFLYKYLKRKTYQGNPSLLIALGPMQSEHINKEFKKNIPTTIHPCGVKEEVKIELENNHLPNWYDGNKIVLGYCGNLNDAHNAEFIKRVCDHINPEKHLMVLSLYGNKANEVLKYAKQKQGVFISDYIDRIDLIDIHLVTLLSSWTHIAVPSKAMSAISMNASILFCGNRKSDIWQLFKDAGWLIEESKNINIEIKKFFEDISKEKLRSKKEKSPAIREKLVHFKIQSYEDIAMFVKKLSH